MSAGEYVYCVLGVLVALFFISLLWGLLDELTGSPKPPWYRRLFWRKTVADLLAELKAGQRTEISGAEIELAQAYSRSQLPSGLRFPKKDEIYEAKEDFNVTYLTAHCAPFTGGGHAILPKGERVQVCEPSSPEPLSVYCDPLNYDALHERIVPAEDRAHERYTGYYLSISTVDLNRNFTLIENSTDTETDSAAKR